jgi:hypothetical protein
MTDDPMVPDKYPLLVIPGYIYSAKKEPLTAILEMHLEAEIK